MIDNHEEVGKPGLLFIADFEKAFDTVKWDFIQKSLQFFNFGETIIQWVKVLNNQPTSEIVNNG